MRKIKNNEVPPKTWGALVDILEVGKAAYGHTYIRGKVCGIDVELSLAPNDFGFIASAEADNVTAMSELYKRIWDLRKLGIFPMIYNYGHLYVELYVKGE